MYTTINQVRRAFWLSRQWSGFSGWTSTHNDYNPDIRFDFSVFVESMNRDGFISDKLANNITL